MGVLSMAKIGRPKLKIKYQRGLTRRHQQNKYYAERARLILSLMPDAQELDGKEMLLAQIGRIEDFFQIIKIIELMTNTKGGVQRLERVVRTIRSKLPKVGGCKSK